MGKYIEKMVFIICGFLTLLLVLKIGPKVIDLVHVIAEEPTLTYCEMTEREREFLKEESNYQEADVKRYDEGMLYSSEVKEVEWLRQLYADLEERYPGYRFHVSDKTHDDLFGPNGYYKYYTEEEITGRTFYTYIFYDDQRNYGHEQDSFYGYFVEEDYAEYLKEQLEKRQIEDIVKVEVKMPYSMGSNCNSSMKIDDIINGNIRISSQFKIYMYAGGRTEEECKMYAKSLQSELEDTNLYGTYDIYYCDMEEEEILSADTELEYVYISRSESWNWGKENK